MSAYDVIRIPETIEIQGPTAYTRCRACGTFCEVSGVIWPDRRTTLDVEAHACVTGERGALKVDLDTVPVLLGSLASGRDAHVAAVEKLIVNKLRAVGFDGFDSYRGAPA